MDGRHVEDVTVSAVTRDRRTDAQLRLRSTKKSAMAKTIKLVLAAGIAAVALGGLAPGATASDCDGCAPSRQVCHVLEARDHVGMAVHNLLNPR